MSRQKNTRPHYLTTLQWYNLNQAVGQIVRAFDSHPYLVGSVLDRPDFRDVDVRLILDDKEFDDLFAENKALWNLLCVMISERLCRDTQLPIDFQIQRQTEANVKYSGLRNALGITEYFANGGDATKFVE